MFKQLRSYEIRDTRVREMIKNEKEPLNSGNEPVRLKTIRLGTQAINDLIRSPDTI